MFDNLQEAVILLSQRTDCIEFTNQLSNNLLKTMLGITDLYSNTDAKSGKAKTQNPLDQ